jgi:hypothetical protein
MPVSDIQLEAEEIDGPEEDGTLNGTEEEKEDGILEDDGPEEDGPEEDGTGETEEEKE